MITFASAIAHLAHILKRLEEDPDLHVDVLDPIGDAEDAIDRRAAVLTALKHQIEGAKELLDKAKGEHDRLVRLERSLTAQVLAAMQAHPDWTWSGKRWTLSTVKVGGQQAVAFSPLAGPAPLPRVVGLPNAFPEEWVEQRTVWVLKEGFEEALRAGRVEERGAQLLPRGERLVVRAK